jgi:hypothetical protein
MLVAMTGNRGRGRYPYQAAKPLDRDLAKGGESEMPLATENLYLGAYALSQGARLKGVVVSRSNGKTTAVFELDGPWVNQLQDEYYRGTAVVNLAEYRRHLEALKDKLFAALRRSESERREDHAHRKARARGAQARR